MTERHLILVKHAMPDLKPEQASSLWTLSEIGRASCISLADALAPYSLAAIVSSTEPKARETAELTGHCLNLPVEVALDLHEHDRTGVPFLADPAEWDAAIVRFFAEPDKQVLGRETARAAQTRFITAIDDVLERHTGGNIAVVAHGTVISLFVAYHAGVDPMPFWRRLGLPSFVMLRLPTFELEAVVETIFSGTAGLSSRDDERYTHPEPRDRPSR